MSTITYRIVRYSMAALFLWFGLSQIAHPGDWLAYLPSWVEALPVSPSAFLQLNGMFEVVLGAALLVGVMTRWAAALLAIHLFVIAATVAGDIGLRDAALAAATGSLSFSQPDGWTLDRRRRR